MKINNSKLKIEGQLKKYKIKIRYVSDKIIGKHIACYNIKYSGFILKSTIIVRACRELLHRISFESKNKVLDDLRVILLYKGKNIYPAAALKLNIPLNELWISKNWKKHKDHILFHELKEIGYRYNGFSEQEAHKQAQFDTKNFIKNNN